MKYIRQMLIILVVSFLGELCSLFLIFPIPGNIYGMILMFGLLMSGCIKIHQVKDTASFMLDIMPILFIPSAVGIMTKLDAIKSIWWQIIIITIMSTIIVLAVSGLVTQKILRNDDKKEKENGRRS